MFLLTLTAFALLAHQPAQPHIEIDGAAIRQMASTGWRATDDKAARWLWQAAYDGDADVLGALLSAGADPGTVRDDGTTILMAAAVSGDAESVRLLIAASADPTFRDRAGRDAADRVRDAMHPPPLPPGLPPRPPRVVNATGRPPQYDLILKLLTNE
ncbi:MAG: ankyrin repeat domain-containing protein [Vicinamibacterales bacterium]